MVRNLMLAGAALLFSAPVWGQTYVSGGISVVFGRPAPAYYYPQPVMPVVVQPVPVPYPVIAAPYRIPHGHLKKMRRGYAYAPSYYYGDRYYDYGRGCDRRRRR